MGYLISIGDSLGEVLLDLDGLFRVVCFETFAANVCEKAQQAQFVGILLLQREAWLFRASSTPLHTSWNQAWLDRLLEMLRGVGNDPFRAEEVAERVFLRRIFAMGLQGFLKLDESLRILEQYAREARELREQQGRFSAESQWQHWLDELSDIEARMQNLRVTLGRFAVRMGDRWLVDRGC